MKLKAKLLKPGSKGLNITSVEEKRVETREEELDRCLNADWMFQIIELLRMYGE